MALELMGEAVARQRFFARDTDLAPVGIDKRRAVTCAYGAVALLNMGVSLWKWSICSQSNSDQAAVTGSSIRFRIPERGFGSWESTCEWKRNVLRITSSPIVGNNF